MSPEFYIPSLSEMNLYSAKLAAQRAKCHVMPSDTADAAVATQGATSHVMPSDTTDAASTMLPRPRIFIPAPSELKHYEAAVATQGATSHVMPSDTAEDHHIHAGTRPECSLPFDESNRPHKKAKTLLTTASVKLDQGSEDLRSLREYQLARARRDTIAGRVKYHRLRIHEIDMMGVIARDELEVVEALMKNADLQVDEIGRDLCCSSDTFTIENIDKLAWANPPRFGPFPELGPLDSSSNVSRTPTPSEDEYSE